MESQFPNDLREMYEWADVAIRTAFDLWNAKQADQVNAARKRLIQHLLDQPLISASLARELAIASDRYQRDEPDRIAGTHAAHPLQAVQKLCWQVLKAALLQSRAMIELKIALGREVKNTKGRLPWGHKQRVGALAAINTVLEDQKKLCDCLPKFDRVVCKFPASVQSQTDRTVPPLPMILCPGDGLDVLLQKVVYRVWNERLAARPRPDDELGKTSRHPSKQRGRGAPKTTDSEKDAKIAAQWEQCRSQYRTLEAFARACGGEHTANSIRKALDRVRKRKRK